MKFKAKIELVEIVWRAFWARAEILPPLKQVGVSCAAFCNVFVRFLCLMS